MKKVITLMAVVMFASFQTHATNIIRTHVPIKLKASGHSGEPSAPSEETNYACDFALYNITYAGTCRAGEWTGEDNFGNQYLGQCSGRFVTAELTDGKVLMACKNIFPR